MQLLTIPEAAAELGLTEKALRRRIEQGTLGSMRQGSRRMIPRTEVDRLRAELDFPSDPADVGKGQEAAGNPGNPTTELVVQLGKAVETVRVETERRVMAEYERDAAVERERSERQAREAAELEIVELRARVTQLEAPPAEDSPEVGEVGEAATVDGAEPERRAWWERMLGGRPPAS